MDDLQKKVLVGFIVIFLIIVTGLIICSFLVSGYWPLNKWTTCEMFNKSFSDCDEFWCNIIDCEYQNNISACVCDTNNKSEFDVNINLSDFYNRSDFDYREFYNMTETYNKSEIDAFIANLSENITKLELNSSFEEYMSDSEAKELRDNLLDKLEEEINAIKEETYQRSYYNNPNYNQEIPWWLVAIIIIAILCFIGFLIYNKTHEKPLPQPKYYNKPFYQQKKKFFQKKQKQQIPNPNQYYGNEESEETEEIEEIDDKHEQQDDEEELIK